MTIRENVVGYALSGSQTKLSTGWWLWKVGLMRSTMIIGNIFRRFIGGYAAVVCANLLISFVLLKWKNDNHSSIIGDDFLDPYIVDYIGQTVNHQVPTLRPKYNQIC